MKSCYLFAVLLVAVRGGVWNLIDVPSVVCGTGGVKINIWQENRTSAVDAADEKPYISTFYRTSNNGVDVTFSLSDSSDPPQVIVPTQVVNLQPLASPTSGVASGAFTPGMMTTQAPAAAMPSPGKPIAADGRRLADNADENCEHFYLLDGRTPVEIPDTWGLARESFRDICERDGYSAQGCSDAEQKLFNECPDDDESFLATAALCDRLLGYAAATTFFDPEASSSDVVLLEPPKGAMPMPKLVPRRMKGYGSYGYGWSSSGGSYGGSYGYSTGRLSRSYPHGYYSTPYGYSGYHVYSGPIVLAYPIHHHHYYGMYDRSCPGGTLDQYGCTRTLDLQSNVNRDDVMGTGFKASDYKYPLVLQVMQVSGIDFLRQNVCPPADADDSWKPPQMESLFFTVSQVDQDEPPASFFAVIMGMFSSTCCCCLPCICLYFMCQSTGKYLSVPVTPTPSQGYTNFETAESAPGANGKVLFQGSRVQTENTIGEGGDGRWYNATVINVYADGTVQLKYDDGDTDRMPSAVVHLL